MLGGAKRNKSDIQVYDSQIIYYGFWYVYSIIHEVHCRVFYAIFTVHKKKRKI